MLFCLCSVAPFFLALLTVAAEETSCKNSRELVNNLLDWFVQRGGVLNPKVEFRTTGEGCDSSFDGIFALKDLKKNEQVAVIPKETVIFSGQEEEFSGLDFECDMVHALIREIKLGSESKYDGYVNYLLAQDGASLPSFWTDAGKALLHQVLDFPSEVDPSIGNIPPANPTGLVSDWLESCEGSDDSKVSLHALSQVCARSWDLQMIAIFDMFAHRNDPYRNIDSTQIDPYKGQDIIVYAIRDIKQGEQIYNSYNKCAECDGRTTYGTPQILRDYGFVEEYPQRWVFFFDPDTFEVELGFEVHEEDGVLELEWLADTVYEEGEDYLEGQQQRLKGIEYLFESKPANIPQGEWDKIVRFYKSARFVFDSAVEQLALVEEEEYWEDEL